VSTFDPSTLAVPRLVRAVVDACHAAGGRALLVGGSVRDHCMGLPIKDWDLEVHGLPLDALESVLSRLGRVDTVGRAFAVFKLHQGPVELDVSIPRSDSKAGPGHRGIVAVGDPHLGVVEATRRRDLTINAMLLDLRTGELLDPWDGAADLAARVLRPVDVDTFLEDPLRALRAIQFAARLAFTPTASLRDLCRRAPLDELPPERILGEWTKLLLKATRPSVGLDLARDTDVLARVFPEAPSDVRVGPALDRAAALRDRFSPEGRALALMTSVWLAGSPPAAIETTLDRLRLYRWFGHDTRKDVHAIVAHLDDATDTDAALRWLSTRAEVSLTLAAHAAVHDVDVDAAQSRAEALGVSVVAPTPWVTGRDLAGAGVKPGRAMGQLLQDVYAAQLDGTFADADSARACALARGAR